jgi:hypothetical protein
MDRDSLRSYFEFDSTTESTIDFIMLMADRIPEEQFMDCLREMFEQICEDESDTDQTIESVIERTWDDIDLFGEPDDDNAFLEIDEYLKDRFHFVKVMFEVGLEDEAKEFCQRISEGLKKVSEEPRFKEYAPVLLKQREELLEYLDKEEYTRWFEY